MKITIEVRTEALGPNRYGVVGLRPDGSECFRVDGLWSSSSAQQKAEDQLRRLNPRATILWDPNPGVQEAGEVLYRGSALVPGDS